MSPITPTSVYLTIECKQVRIQHHAPVYPLNPQHPCRLQFRWQRHLLAVAAACKAPPDSSAKNQDVVLFQSEPHQTKTSMYVSIHYSAQRRPQTDINVHQHLGLSIKQAIQRRGGKQVQAYVVMALHDDGDVTTHTTDQVSRCTGDIFASDAEERLRIAHKESMLRARTGEGYLGTFVSLQHSRHVLTVTRRPQPDLSPQLWRCRFPRWCSRRRRLSHGRITTGRKPLRYLATHLGTFVWCAQRMAERL